MIIMIVPRPTGVIVEGRCLTLVVEAMEGNASLPGRDSTNDDYDYEHDLNQELQEFFLKECKFKRNLQRKLLIACKKF